MLHVQGSRARWPGVTRSVLKSWWHASTGDIGDSKHMAHSLCALQVLRGERSGGKYVSGSREECSWSRKVNTLMPLPKLINTHHGQLVAPPALCHVDQRGSCMSLNGYIVEQSRSKGGKLQISLQFTVLAT